MAVIVITGQQGRARVIRPLQMAQADQSFSAEELIKVERPSQVTGDLIDSGFTEGQLWFAFSGGLLLGIVKRIVRDLAYNYQG